MKKRLISFILVFCMTVALIPFGIFSASAAKSGKVGDCSWRLEGTVLTISGEGSMGEHLKSRPWGDKITKVIVKKGVTSICDNAFYMCKSLKTITLPSTLVYIGAHAFWGCDSLESITIPDGVTDIGDGAFNDCGSLSSINIPKSVISVGYGIFRDCFVLERITVDEQNKYFCSVDGVLFSKDMTELIKYPVLQNGNQVSSYTVPDSVTKISSTAFYDALLLYDIILPSGITDLSSHSFYKCGAHVAAKQNGDDVFYIGEYLICAIDKNKKTYEIKEGTRVIADGAFNGCAQMRKIAIPDGVEYIGSNAFSFCTRLTSMSFPNSLKKISHYLADSVPLEKIYFRGSEQERNKISISKANEELKKATWYFDACYESEKHSFGNSTVISEAECGVEGLSEKVCKTCGFIRQEVIPALDHEYGIVSQVTAPTCVSAGVEASICKICGYNDERYVEPTGHIFGAWREEVAPTCTEIGITKRYCAMCDVSEAQIINATGHNYDIFNVIKEPSVSEEGYKAAACMTCGDIKTEVIPRDNVRGVISVWQGVTVLIGLIALASVTVLLIVISRKNKKLKAEYDE